MSFHYYPIVLPIPKLWGPMTTLSNGNISILAAPQTSLIDCRNWLFVMKAGAFGRVRGQFSNRESDRSPGLSDPA